MKPKNKVRAIGIFVVGNGSPENSGPASEYGFLRRPYCSGGFAWGGDCRWRIRSNWWLMVNVSDFHLNWITDNNEVCPGRGMEWPRSLIFYDCSSANGSGKSDKVLDQSWRSFLPDLDRDCVSDADGSWNAEVYDPCTNLIMESLGTLVCYIWNTSK